MNIRFIPQDINVELLLAYLAPGSYKVSMKGLHKRNTYNDISDLKIGNSGELVIDVARNGIYDVLPEYLFHPINRFKNLQEDKERFKEELENQEKEKKDAHRLFSPMDLQLLLYRVMAREELRPVTETNSILHNILADNMTDEQRANRLIAKTIPLLPACKIIRGNKTLLTFLLRKVLMEESVTVTPQNILKMCSDEEPQYVCQLGDTLTDTFMGNVYDEMVAVYDINYWPETVDETFLTLVDEMEVFRRFVQDYFMSMEEMLQFNIRHDEPTMLIGDVEIYNYLDFNTNL